MNMRLAHPVLFVTFLVTLPCFVFLLFCSGFLPVAGMAVLAARFVATLQPGVLLLLIPLMVEGVAYVVALHLIARAVVRRLPSDPRRARVAIGWIVAGCLLSTALPIQAFDCMDGHSVTRCSALQMYFGWLRARAPGETLYSGAQCGEGRTSRSRGSSVVHWRGKRSPGAQ